MRVLIPTGLFYPSKLGGPAKTLYWLAKGLISKGVDVSVVTSNNFIEKGLVEFDSWVSVEGIHIRYCTIKSKLSLKVIWYSIKELRKCDVVLLSSIFYIPSIFIALFSSFTSKKIIWSPRGELFKSALNGRGEAVKKLYIITIRVILAKRVVFHATSQYEQRILKEHFGDNIKTVIIPNYLEVPEKQKRIE